MSYQRASNRRLTWLAILCAVGLVAAACGGDDDSADADVDDATTTTQAPTDDGSEGDEPDSAAEDADAPAPDDPAELTATDIGVTESAIKVGAVFPNTALIARDPGDIEAKFRTIADRINEAGGINGRMIELSVRLTNPLDDEDSESVCIELTEDIEVFAALGTFVRTTADCYGALNDTIVISTFGISAEQMERYTAPGITLPALPARLIEDRVQALLDGDVLRDGMKVAVVGGTQGAEQQAQYVDALRAAGVDVVADTLILGDGNDLLALTDELTTLTEVWRSSGAEAVIGSAGLVSQSLLIAYNQTDIDLPMILPQGTAVNPSLMRDQQGLDLAPFELATALVEGDSQAQKYESGADGVRECVDAFQEASGEEVALDESRNNLGVTIIACQVFDIFVPIAEAAGVNLTTETFREAAEAFGPIEVTDVAEASLGPGKFDLSDSVGVIATFNPETAQFEPVG